MKTRTVVLRKKNNVVSTVNAIDSDALAIFEDKKAFIAMKALKSATDLLEERRATHYANKYEIAREVVKSVVKSNKRAKSEKHACVSYIESLIEQARYTHKEILASACVMFSDLARITIATYLSDSKNPSEKYGFRRHKFSRLAKTDSNKVMHY
jgi:hypothetical protein